jgi:serine/threonine-protein kinase
MAQAPVASMPAIGEVVGGKFRVMRLLGQGGMGAVFAAQHEILGREVALKLLLAEALGEPEAVKRFLNEARAASRIQGDHVARVLDVGLLDDGRPYISMELLEGEDLASVLEKHGALEPTAAVDLLLQAMEAIAEAHALGIVHRDLKPSNLFLAARPDGSTLLKVLDFGIAKVAGGDPQLQVQTSTKAMMGSPLYMSPEQIRSVKSADAQSDVWALGAIGYELLTGSPPFRGESIGEVFLAIVEQVPEPAHERRPGVPPELSAVLARCLQRDRALRFQNVAELAAALVPFASSQGALSAGRIAATTDRSRSGAGVRDVAAGLASSPRVPSAGVTPVSHPRVDAAPQRADVASTNDSWAGLPPPAPRTGSRVGLLLGVGGAVLAVGVVVAWLGARGHTAASRSQSVPTPEPTVAAPAGVAPIATSESSSSSPPASVSAAPVASSAPVRPGASVRPWSAGAPGARPAVKPGPSGITTNKEWF